MVNGRGPLCGQPSGLRVNVPLAGMPPTPGIRLSGQIPLPSWASVDVAPSEWEPPLPSFEDSVSRQRELARLLARLQEIEFTPDDAMPILARLVQERPASEDEVSDHDINSLWSELEFIESDAAQRSKLLLGMQQCGKFTGRVEYIHLFIYIYIYLFIY